MVKLNDTIQFEFNGKSLMNMTMHLMISQIFHIAKIISVV